jgi:hypothetical protein
MPKKRSFPVHYDFKTGLLCKFFLFIGSLLFILFIFLKIFSFLSIDKTQDLLGSIYHLSISNIPDTTLGFSIIFLGIGLILYFFQHQFAKLAEIADEIEQDEKNR